MMSGLGLGGGAGMMNAMPESEADMIAEAKKAQKSAQMPGGLSGLPGGSVPKGLPGLGGSGLPGLGGGGLPGGLPGLGGASPASARKKKKKKR